MNREAGGSPEPTDQSEPAGSSEELERSNPGQQRAIRREPDLDHLAFDERGLVPVIAQDARDGAVLMMAWANRQALEHSLESGDLHFWSRSRGRLWRKGETSGHVLRLVSLHRDCDGDTVLARVRPSGPACHTGTRTCFGEGTEPSGGRDTLERLQDVLDERKRERPPDSYTTRLLEDGNLRLKKLGEETAELIAALARGRREEAIQEAADLFYHLLVALAAEDLGMDDVHRALASRMD